MALSKRELIEPARGISGSDERADASEFIECEGMRAAVSPSHGFWTRPHIEDGGPGEPPVIQNITELRASFWPEDESVDEFVSFVHQQRAADRDSHQ